MQLPLFEWENPFREKIKSGILDSVPNVPGIYRFYSKNKELLYVGKSIELKKRIQSYGRIKPETDSNRLVRLVSKIDFIEFDLCENEQRALLKENEWLRKMNPPFNKANTRPDLYGYVGMSIKNDSIQIGWVLNEHSHSFDKLYGSFKGLSRLYSMLGSLRLVGGFMQGESVHQKKWFVKKPPTFSWAFSASNNEFGIDMLENYFMGEAFPVSKIFERILFQSSFEQRVFNDSFSNLIVWFTQKAMYNRYLREKNNIKNELIPQDGFDDWAVKSSSNLNDFINR